MSEEWDAEKVVAECKIAADKKTSATRRRPRRRHDAPPITVVSEAKPGDPEKREGKDPETGRFLPGHSYGPLKPGDTIGSKYDPSYAEQAEKLARMGATGHEIADFFNVSPSTFYMWRNTHEAFADAVKVGWSRTMERATRSLYERAVGYDFVEEQAIKIKVGKDEERVEIVEVRRHQPADMMANMYVHNNRDPDNWKHVRTLQVSGSIDHRLPSPDEARQELADYYKNGGGEVIDVTPTLLPAPDAEEATEIGAEA